MRLFKRILSIFHKRTLDREMDAEMRAHVEQRTQANIEAGMNPEEARFAALRQFGWADSIREQCRDQRGLRWLEEFAQDVRYGARQLRKNPGFTVVAVVTLALGIGANTAIFSLVHALLFRPLPFQDPARLVWIANAIPGVGGLSSETTRVSNFSDWRRQNQSFESLAAFYAFFEYGGNTLTHEGEASRIQGVRVSQNFLDTLGVQPRLGRNFVEEECRWKGRKAVLLTDACWRRRFHGRADIVGQAIILDNVANEVVGVLPPSFDFSSIFAPNSNLELITPFPISPETDRWGNTLSVVGRLKPGVTLRSAQAEFDLINERLLREFPDRGKVFGARMTPLPQRINGQFRRPVLLLFGAVGCVLLIACANLSNLLLSRAMARRKEVAVRVALGASRLRLIRQMLTESLLLSCFGAALGLPLAYGATSMISQSHAFSIALLRTVGVDGTALGFTLAVAFASGLLFGIIPALQLSRGSAQDSLKLAGRGGSHGRGHAGVREGLIVAEVALACVLLVGAGLLLRSFVRLLDVDPGFRPEQAAAWRIDPSRSFTNTTELTVYFKELKRRVEALPGVESAGLSDSLPLGRNRSWGAVAKGQTYVPGNDAFPRVVDEGYIRTMRIPLREGRDFEERDTAEGAPKVAIINETLARRLWPEGGPLGRVFTAGRDFTVIGVAGDVRHSALDEKSGEEMYFLGAQIGWSNEELVVRAKGSIDVLARDLRATLHELDPGMPLDKFRSLGQIIDQAVSPKRLIVILLGLFSALALALASIGIYGVINYAVSQRTPELGIRLALGASSSDISRLVVAEGMRPVALGLALGLGAALAVTQVMRGLLFGTSAADPLTFALIAVLLMGVALLACWLPARRASKVDPMVALRID